LFEPTLEPDKTKTAQAMKAAKRFVTARDKDGRTALHALVDLSGRLVKPDARVVARMLIKHGAVVDARDKDGRTPLIASGLQPDVASELINAGADVNAQDNNGETPLMNSYVPWLTRLLLERGADIHARNIDGRTALDRSKEYGASETTPVLEWWLAKSKAQR
jgi:ankyrin repeat protein